MPEASDQLDPGDGLSRIAMYRERRICLNYKPAWAYVKPSSYQQPPICSGITEFSR